MAGRTAAGQGFATFSNLEMQHSPKIFCIFLQKVLAKNKQKQVDDISFGVVTERNVSMSVYNKNLDNDIKIYDAYQDDNWSVELENNNDLLTLFISTSKEDCMKIAEHINYY